MRKRRTYKNIKFLKMRDKIHVICEQGTCQEIELKRNDRNSQRLRIFCRKEYPTEYKRKSRSNVVAGRTVSQMQPYRLVLPAAGTLLKRKYMEKNENEDYT